MGFGSGLLKPGPGTWGTLAALPLYGLVAVYLHLPIGIYLTIVVLGFLVGVYLCAKTAEDVGVHDHGAIVWDEIIGFLVTMLAVPPTVCNVVLGFILFRIFDILKPWPIKVVDEKVHGGFGIMIDDVIAGLVACLILHLLQAPLNNIL